MPEIVSAAEAKRRLHIGGALIDTEVNELIDYVEELVARSLSFGIGAQTHTDRLDGGRVLIPRSLPLVSITSVTDLWNNDDVIDSGDYEIDPDGRLQILRRLSGESPSTWELGRGRWEVVYEGGYRSLTQEAATPGLPADSMLPPAGLKLGILDLVVREYRNRAGVSSSMNRGVGDSYRPYSESDIRRILAKYDLQWEPV